ncbi:MAG: alpha/beta hydrolase fold domain-containing protein [Verrucomicrobiota bacterium]
MRALLPLLLAAALTPAARADEVPGLARSEVIYGRKFGTALTLDVLQPARTNGYGVVSVVSGGFYSSHEGIHPGALRPILDRGYTVFAVVHGSQPRFTIPEIKEDLHRAVRWIRSNAARHGVRADRLGVFGSSAGGHLSLTLGVEGGPGDPLAKDPVDRESSAVQAVACFFPPTDFETWGRPGDTQVGVGRVGRAFHGAFGPRSETAEERARLGPEISPVRKVSATTPPCLLIHGDADGLVPIYQARIFVDRMSAVGAISRLIVKPGADHGWSGIEKDLVHFADWYDEHLRGLKR